MTTKELGSFKADTIDSRDLVERLSEVIDLLDEVDEDQISADSADEIAELHEERDALEEIVETIDGYGGDNAADGVQLIRNSYFVLFAQAFAEEIGRIEGDADWPYTHIDWEGAADELQMDFTSVEINGQDYWFR